jgi:heme-degrading monooxygenase HmoA
MLSNFLLFHKPPLFLRYMSHYIAMNRFKIVKGHEKDFEDIWKTRTTYLEEVPGFLKFNLLKGPERDDHVLYASHTQWENESHFENWTNSEAFRKAHSGAGNRGHLYLGHPEFEGFKVVDGASVK